MTRQNLRSIWFIVFLALFSVNIQKVDALTIGDIYWRSFDVSPSNSIHYGFDVSLNHKMGNTDVVVKMSNRHNNKHLKQVTLSYVDDKDDSKWLSAILHIETKTEDFSQAVMAMSTKILRTCRLSICYQNPTSEQQDRLHVELSDWLKDDNTEQDYDCDEGSAEENASQDNLIDDLAYSENEEDAQRAIKSYRTLLAGKKQSIDLLVDHLNDERKSYYNFVGAVTITDENGNEVPPDIGYVSRSLIRRILVPDAPKRHSFDPLAEIEDVKEWWSINRHNALNDLIKEIIRRKIDNSTDSAFINYWKHEISPSVE